MKPTKLKQVAEHKETFFESTFAYQQAHDSEKCKFIEKAFVQSARVHTPSPSRINQINNLRQFFCFPMYKHKRHRSKLVTSIGRTQRRTITRVFNEREGKKFPMTSRTIFVCFWRCAPTETRKQDSRKYF